MVERSNVKITVVKRMDSQDVLGRQIPETSDGFQDTCTLWEKWREFVIQEDGKMPI